MGSLRELVKKHEGLRLKVYDCGTGQPLDRGSEIVGRPTIGYGRNLASVGITEAEAEAMLDADLARATRFCEQNMPGFSGLNGPRQAVVVSMAFQLGPRGLLAFRKFRAAVARGDFQTAAVEMLSSRWADQTPNRAKELARMMTRGEW